MTTALLLVLLAAGPAADGGLEAPHPQRPDEQLLHVWTEPITLVRNLTDAQNNHPAVIPLGFEYRLAPPMWLAVEVTMLYVHDEGIGTIVGGVLSAGAQFQLAHAGPVSFFVEPKLIVALAHQQPADPRHPFGDCTGDGCVAERTQFELGLGANAGAAVTWRSIYLSVVVGGQLTFYGSGTDSLVGNPFVVLNNYILNDNHGVAISPNLSFLRLGASF